MLKLRNPFYRPTAATPVDPNMSAAERYAKTIRETAVDEILKTIKASKRLGMLLVLLVIVISFQHQRDFFSSHHAGSIGSIGLPLIFDVSIIWLVGVISTTGMNKVAVWMAAGALVIPVGASATINFVASPDVIVGWAYVVAIGLVAVIETIKALIKPDPAALREVEHSADAPAAAVAKPKRQISEHEIKARKRAGYDAMTPTDKKAWTKRYQERIARSAPQSPAWAVENPTAEELAAIA